MKQRAFTLAEVLITLMIIGVVAVLVIPAFVTNVKDTTLNGQRKTANMKLLEGFRQMRVDGKLMEKYDSTEAFVKEMQKYFKINAVCNNDNLSSCFNTSFSFFNTTINASGKEEYGETAAKTLDDIKDIKKIDSKAYADYDNFWGIKFADGVNMLIAYNTKCIGPEDGNTSVGKENVAELATCFAYFYDVNAAQAPNIKGKDIISNVSFADEKFKFLGNAPLLSQEECIAFTNEHPDLIDLGDFPAVYEMLKEDDPSIADMLSPEYCIKGESNNWQGAIKTCYEIEPKGTWRLPTNAELDKLVSDIYGDARGKCGGMISDECATEAVRDKLLSTFGADGADIYSNSFNAVLSSPRYYYFSLGGWNYEYVIGGGADVFCVRQ